jgi:hypothetical protein
MATPYNNSFDNTTPFSDTASNMALAANTELTYTVPGTGNKKYKAEFSWPYNANVWVSINETAVVPTPGTIVTSARCELRPTYRYVVGGDVLHFISSSIVTDAGFRLLQLPNS